MTLLDQSIPKIAEAVRSGETSARELVARPETNTVVERAASAVLGRPVAVVHEQESQRASGKKTLSLLSAEERERKVREAYDNARKHPRISEAVEILGARLKDLRLAKVP